MTWVGGNLVKVSRKTADGYGSRGKKIMDSCTWGGGKVHRWHIILNIFNSKTSPRGKKFQRGGRLVK